MHGYVNHEGEGKKRDNSVVIVIKHFLFNSIIPSDFVPNSNPMTNKLTWVCNNCPVKKNNVALRIANMLVEGGYFHEIIAHFLAKGHTKNSCDRNFNAMKLLCHHQKICTKEQAITVLGHIQHVKIINVDSTCFHDYELKHKELYRK